MRIKHDYFYTSPFNGVIEWLCSPSGKFRGFAKLEDRNNEFISRHTVILTMRDYDKSIVRCMDNIVHNVISHYEDDSGKDTLAQLVSDVAQLVCETQSGIYPNNCEYHIVDNMVTALYGLIADPEGLGCEANIVILMLKAIYGVLHPYCKDSDISLRRKD